MDRVLYRTLLLFAATLLVVYGFLLILSPFLVAIGWALCAAAITYPGYLALAKRWRRPRLAALAMVAFTSFVMIVPIVVITYLAVGEISRMVADEAGIRTWITNLRGALPRVYELLDRVRETFGVADSVEQMMRQVAQSAADLFLRPVTRGAFSVVGGLFQFCVGLVVMLATQYFVYTGGAGLRELAIELSPLPREDTGRVLETLRGATVAAVMGGFLVSAIQGALGGLGFLFVGVGSPVIWGLVMALFSLLPMGGAAFVWAPVAIYLLASGETARAWGLAAWGLIVVGGIDNVLRPWLLRRVGAGGVHPMLLFFAILSGIGLFGMSGLVFGPLLIALLMAVAQVYRDHVAPLVASREEGRAEA